MADNVTYGEITPDRRDDALKQLLGDEFGQRMNQYLNGEKTFFSEQEQAFVDAFDGLMVSFLNARVVEVQPNERAAFDYVGVVRDAVMTQEEMNRIVSDDTLFFSQNERGEAVLRPYGALREHMGEELHQRLQELYGGIVNGAADAEDTSIARYTRQELAPFYSPRAKSILEAVNDRTLADFMADDLFDGSIINMNNICGTPVPPPTNLQIIGFQR